MLATRLRACRSLLFLPASNPRAIEKARGLPADLVILDLEDAVKAEDKKDARKAACDAAGKGFGGRLVAIRANPHGSSWHRDDIEAVAASAADLLVLPKVQSVEEITAPAAGGKPVVAMIETARAVLAAPEIARNCSGLIAGTNDLAFDLGIPLGSGRAGLAHSLQAIVLAARAARISAFDGVYNRIDDLTGLARECREGREYGFDGKSVIHPAQIETANSVFTPGADEVSSAIRLIEAFGGGAQRFEGRMIEDMHVAEARAIIAKAGAAS